MLERLELQAGGDTTLTLFGVTEAPNILRAQGYYSPVSMQKGQAIAHEGRYYLLPCDLEPGVYFVCQEDTPQRLKEPLELKGKSKERRNQRGQDQR